MNTNGLILDGLQMSTIVKITKKRVSKITMTELKTVLSLITKDEARLLLMAIRKGDQSMMLAAFQIPVYRIMENMVINDQEDVIATDVKLER